MCPSSFFFTFNTFERRDYHLGIDCGLSTRFTLRWIQTGETKPAGHPFAAYIHTPPLAEWIGALNGLASFDTTSAAKANDNSANG